MRTPTIARWVQPAAAEPAAAVAGTRRCCCRLANSFAVFFACRCLRPSQSLPRGLFPRSLSSVRCGSPCSIATVRRRPTPFRSLRSSRSSSATTSAFTWSSSSPTGCRARTCGRFTMYELTACTCQKRHAIRSDLRYDLNFMTELCPKGLQRQHRHSFHHGVRHVRRVQHVHRSLH